MSTTETIETPAGVGESVRSIVDSIRESANVGTVYGDPIDAGGKTIIPVARVAYGFDSGGESDDGGESEGGGVAATPATRCRGWCRPGRRR